MPGSSQLTPALEHGRLYSISRLLPAQSSDLLCHVGESKLNLLEVTSLNAFTVLGKHVGASSRLAHHTFTGQNIPWGVSVHLGLGRCGAEGSGQVLLQPSVVAASTQSPCVAASLHPGFVLQTCRLGNLQVEGAGEGLFCEFLMVLLPWLVLVTAEPVWFSENWAENFIKFWRFSLIS